MSDDQGVYCSRVTAYVLIKSLIRFPLYKLVLLQRLLLSFFNTFSRKSFLLSSTQ